MTESLFTIETPKGVYVTKFTPWPTAHVFRLEYLADRFTEDAHDASLMVTPVLDLVVWLESVRDDGITDVTEHGVADCRPHRIEDWIQKLRGG